MDEPKMTASRRAMLQATAAAVVTAAAGPARAAAPFFKLYLMIPNNQPARVVWGTVAAQQMQKLGIDVVSSIVPFTAIAPRRAQVATARRTWMAAGTRIWSATIIARSSRRRWRCSAP